MKVGDVEGGFGYWIRWRLATFGWDRGTAEIYRRLYMPTAEDLDRYGPHKILEARREIDRGE